MTSVFIVSILSTPSVTGRDSLSGAKHPMDTIEKQETQLSLTNRATGLEVSQGHQTWYHSIWFPISVQL